MNIDRSGRLNQAYTRPLSFAANARSSDHEKPASGRHTPHAARAEMGLDTYRERMLLRHRQALPAGALADLIDRMGGGAGSLARGSVVSLRV